MPVKEIKVYKVQSERDPNDWYQVMIDAEHSAGSWCSCQEYLRKRYCDHIEKARTACMYGF